MVMHVRISWRSDVCQQEKAQLCPGKIVLGDKRMSILSLEAAKKIQAKEWGG